MAAAPLARSRRYGASDGDCRVQQIGRPTSRRRNHFLLTFQVTPHAMTKTVLIVDDSTSLRTVVRIALVRAGDEVVEAGDGQDRLGTGKPRPWPTPAAVGSRAQVG